MKFGGISLGRILYAKGRLDLRANDCCVMTQGKGLARNVEVGGLGGFSGALTVFSVRACVVG